MCMTNEKNIESHDKLSHETLEAIKAYRNGLASKNWIINKIGYVPEKE